ncbi:MAG: Verru_Chthon cassette protein B [Candidatus Methylacidiphilales bacterium]|nr:Verru_Chthon cassette protein B [Candidatus Methylacidiphilales bacterium]
MAVFTGRIKGRRAGRGGFSLAEVIISLGVVSFGMLSILGMLPVGLSMFNKARSNTVEAQIVQGISNEILLTDFGHLAAMADQTFYFDNEGKSLPGTDVAQKIYTVVVRLKNLSSSNAFPLSIANDEAYNVQIVIENKFSAGERTFPVLVANNNSNEP